MDHKEERARQLERMAACVEILKTEPSVLGVRLVGSHASGEADAFSDIDLIAYLRDETRSRRAELHARLAALAPLLCQMWVWERHALFLYEDGVRLDVDFLPPGETEKLSPGGRILHDPDGVLAAADARDAGKHAPAPAPHDDATWFFWMFRQILCWARRGEQGGSAAYDKLTAAVDSLAQVRNQLVTIRLWLAGRRDYLGNIDPAMVARLAQTFPELTAPAVVKCTKLLFAEFERLGPSWCERRGRPYPAAQAMTTGRLISEFAAMPP